MDAKNTGTVIDLELYETGIFGVFGVATQKRHRPVRADFVRKHGEDLVAVLKLVPVGSSSSGQSPSPKTLFNLISNQSQFANPGRARPLVLSLHPGRLYTHRRKGANECNKN